MTEWLTGAVFNEKGGVLLLLTKSKKDPKGPRHEEITEQNEKNKVFNVGMWVLCVYYGHLRRTYINWIAVELNVAYNESK